MRFIYNYLALLFIFITGIFPFSALGQIGIGTLNPDASSLMHMASTTQGMLTPRMTTTQRLEIENPANGLLVYDTTLNSFQYYSTSDSRWMRMSAATRDNYVLVKKQADFPAPSGGIITLDENTFYEINGTIILSASINLNNAYISGLDASEDVLSYAGGTIFKGDGGNIRNVTLTGGKAFEITGSGINGGGTFLLQNSTIKNMTTSVGSVTGLSLIFTNVVQYSGNTNGITYSNIGSLLLNNQAWLGSNLGAYEKLTGTFGLVQKVSGFSTVNGSAVGFDVSANPTVDNGVLLSTAFSGTSPTYIKRYITGSYPGYNFTNNWTVSCPGLPVESDNVATGNIYYNGAITSGFVQEVSNQNPFNLQGNTNSNTTSAVNLFRVSSPQNNKIVYLGKKTRTFQINAALSVRGNNNVGSFYAFFIRKNGTNTLTETNTIMRVNNTSDIVSNSISGTVELMPGEFIEIWGQRLVTGSGVSSADTTITVFSLNLNMK